MNSEGTYLDSYSALKESITKFKVRIGKLLKLDNVIYWMSKQFKKSV